MDYCYACRRHLNGAYSCPGCGTPVDELAAPEAHDADQLPAAGGAETMSDAGSPPDRAALRAGRQRRGRHGRRRAAFYGVGAVAVAGALTMFTMAALSDSSGGHAPAAPGAGAQPPSSDSTSAAPGPDDAGLLPSTPGSGSTTGSVSPSPSSAVPISSTSAPGTTTPPSRQPTSAPATSASPTPTASPSPTATATSSVSATPSPSQSTCKQVLWWCS